MKRIASWVMVVCLLVASVGWALAEEGEGTKFSEALLTKGSLLKKEFIETNSFKVAGFAYAIYGQTAILTDMLTGEKVYALRLEHKYYNSKYDSGKSIVVLDLMEIDNVIAALQSLQVEFSKQLRDYTEYAYETADGLKIGAYYNGEKKLFIRFSNSDTEYCDYVSIDSMIQFFQNCKDAIEIEMK